MIRSICSRSPVVKSAAENLRDSLAKGLYEKLFGEIMKKINERFSSSLCSYSIQILDIAGFGKQKILVYQIEK